MELDQADWIEFLHRLAPDFSILQQDPAGNPLLWVQVGPERIRIIQEPTADFSFWLERYVAENGTTGDELVVDVGTRPEQLRLAQNVVEAFVKRRKVLA